MKKHLPATVALICAIAALVCALFLLHTSQRELDDCARQLAALDQENDRLQAQVVQLQELLDTLEATQPQASVPSGGLASWTMDVGPWDDSTGADILLCAAPEVWAEGLEARLLVQLDGQEVLNVPCQWDGSEFTVTASLPAADGYSYYLVILPPDGEQQSYALTSPNMPVLDIPVYLATSLSSYCSLIIDQWEQAAGQILVSSGYIHVQLPRLSAEKAGIESAQLVYTHNSTELSRIPVTLEPGETEDSFQLTITDLSLELPGTQPDDQLELRLEVELTGGTMIEFTGITWFQGPDSLDAVVG